MDRRTFLTATAGAGCASLLPLSQARADEVDLGFDLRKGRRTLDLYRPETGERLNLTYMKDGVWQEGAYPLICSLMRDIHVQEVRAIDHQLIAILDWMQSYLAKYGYNQPILVNSGYRSQRTNARLEGAAKNSQHLLGKAVDIRIPGLPTEYLGKLTIWLSQGGVGVYASKGFVHIDTGRIRTWRG